MLFSGDLWARNIGELRRVHSLPGSTSATPDVVRAVSNALDPTGRQWIAKPGTRDGYSDAMRQRIVCNEAFGYIACRALEGRVPDYATGRLQGHLVWCSALEVANPWVSSDGNFQLDSDHVLAVTLVVDLLIGNFDRGPGNFLVRRNHENVRTVFAIDFEQGALLRPDWLWDRRVPRPGATFATLPGVRWVKTFSAMESVVDQLEADGPGFVCAAFEGACQAAELTPEDGNPTLEQLQIRQASLREMLQDFQEALQAGEVIR